MMGDEVMQAKGRLPGRMVRHTVAVVTATALVVGMAPHAAVAAVEPDPAVLFADGELTMADVQSSIAVALTAEDASKAVLAGGETSIPADGGEPLVAHAPDGATIEVGLPAEGAPSALTDGTVVFDSSAGDAVVSAQALDNGFRALITLASENAPTSYGFSLGGDVVSLAGDGAGGVYGLNADGDAVVGMETPWARDANGADVPTYFEWNGTTLTQVVDHRAGNFAYPITADPSALWYVKCAAQVGKFIVEDGGPGKILKGGISGAKTFAKLLKSRGSKKSALKWLVYELSGANGIADLVDKCYPS